MKKVLCVLLIFTFAFLISCGTDNFENNNGDGVMYSLTGIEPVWFEMENSLPYCVEKA